MKKILKKIGIGVSLSALIFTCVACGKTSNNISNTNDSQKETKIKLDKENAINIGYENNDYKAIYDLFEKQEVKATREYINKTVKVTGEVRLIEKEDGYIVISLVSKTGLNLIDFYFEDTEENEDRIAKIKKYDSALRGSEEAKGDVISIYGIFEEYATRADKTHLIKITNCEF